MVDSILEEEEVVEEKPLSAAATMRAIMDGTPLPPLNTGKAPTSTTNEVVDSPATIMGGILEQSNVRRREKTIADNLENRSEASRRLRSGFDETTGMLYGAGAIAGDMLGIDAVRDWGYEGYERNKKEAELNPGTITKIEDIHSASDAFTWVTGTLAGIAPTMAEMAVATMIGGVAGSSVPGTGSVVGAVAGAANRGLIKSYIKKKITKTLSEKAMIKLAKEQGKDVAERVAAKTVARNIGATMGLTAGSASLEGGGMYTEHADKVGIEDANPWSAASLGLVSGATESFTPGGRVIKRALGMAVQPVKQLTKSKARKILAKAGTKEFLKSVGKTIPKSMGQEGVQEFVQGVLSTLNAFVNDPEEDMLSAENISGYINSAAAGSLAGLFFGGFEGASKYGGSKRTAQNKVDENDPLENFQQNQKRIYDLEQSEGRTSEEDAELSELKQESDWIKTTPEFKENRTQRVADLKEDLATLEKVRNPSEADRKTMGHYRAELTDLIDLSENQRQFEADPLNAANNEDFLDKFIQQGSVDGTTEAQWNEYGEVQEKKGEILKKNKEDDPYWKVQQETIKAQQDVKATKDKLAALNKKENPTNEEIQKIAVLEEELGGHNKKLSAAEKKTNRVAAKARENQRAIERDEHITELENRADKIGLAETEKSAYVADKLKGYDADVAKTVAAARKQRVADEAVAPYFSKTPGSTTMKLSDLKPRNPITSEEGKAKLVRGQEKMAAAAAGTGAKRDPITVYTRDDGQMVVVNGNTTYHALQAMGSEHVAVKEQPTLLQPAESLDEIYAQAEESRGELKSLTEATAKQFGGEASFRPNNEVKDRARAEEKAKNYGTAGKLKDIIASTISFKDEAQLKKALKGFDGGNAVLELKNKFGTPMKSGYRDISMTVRMPNGHFTEIQFTTDAMLKAKNAAGHVIYDLMREVETLNRPSAKKAYNDLLKLSKDYYDAAYSGSLASDNALSSEMGIEVMRISKAIGEGSIGTLVSPSNLKSFSALSSQTKGTPSESKNSSAIKSPPDDSNVTTDKTSVKAPGDKVTVPDIKVKVKYQHEKSGDTVTTTVPAREAMADLEAQESILNKIIDCMG